MPHWVKLELIYYQNLEEEQFGDYFNIKDRVIHELCIIHPQQPPANDSFCLGFVIVVHVPINLRNSRKQSITFANCKCVYISNLNRLLGLIPLNDARYDNICQRCYANLFQIPLESTHFIFFPFDFGYFNFFSFIYPSLGHTKVYTTIILALFFFLSSFTHFSYSAFHFSLFVIFHIRCSI